VAVLDQEKPDPKMTIDTDANCIAKLKDFRSLMPLAQEARKPMFFLKPADGALGAHTYAVTEAYKDFKKVASKIAFNAGLKALA
jgi:chromosome partitioning protein